MSKDLNRKPNISFAFFGTDNFACRVLETLKERGWKPELIITTEDKPQGRKMVITPPPVKTTAEKYNIPVIQPGTLETADLKNLACQKIPDWQPDLFVVASYGKIIPQEILNIPRHGALNIHPSLLPKLRGSSPIQETILQGEEPGVTVIKMDEKMDHGPIVAQETLQIPRNNFQDINQSRPPAGGQNLKLQTEHIPKASELEERLAKLGAEVLAEIMPDWTSGKIEAKDQDHSKATFTKKVKKTDGLIDLNNSPEENYKKFLAYDIWPGTYFFLKRGDREIRVVIKEAELLNGEMKIKRVVPEGKKEMNYEDFLRGVRE